MLGWDNNMLVPGVVFQHRRQFECDRYDANLHRCRRCSRPVRQLPKAAVGVISPVHVGDVHSG